MRIEGQQTYDARREVLWSLLHDPDTLARVLPGCTSLEPIGHQDFRGEFAVRVGQMVETYTGTLSLERSIPPKTYDFVAEGNNPDGMIVCRGRVTLRDEGPEHTTLGYVADIEVSGRPAQLTQRMLQTTARSFARRSLEALQQQVAIRTRVYTTSARSDGHTRGANSSPALERLIFRRRLVTGTLVLLAALLFWRRAGNRRERLVAEQVFGLLEGAGLVPTVADDPSSAAPPDVA